MRFMDKCSRCGDALPADMPVFYVMCSVMRGEERDDVIQTWCADLCAKCEADIVRLLGNVRF